MRKIKLILFVNFANSDAEISDEAQNNTEIVPPSVASRHSLIGDDLRQFRKENMFNSNLFDTTDIQRIIENELY